MIGDSDAVQEDTGVPYAELITDDGLSRIATFAVGIGPSKTLIRPRRPIITPDGLPLDELLPPTDLVVRAHSFNLLVHPYTFRNEPYFMRGTYDNNPNAEYEDFFNLGVDGVFTDFPDTARQVRDLYFTLSTLDVLTTEIILTTSEGDSVEYVPTTITLSPISLIAIVTVPSVIVLVTVFFGMIIYRTSTKKRNLGPDEGFLSEHDV